MAKLEDLVSLENLNKMRQVGETSDIDRIAQKYIKNEALSSSEIDLLNKNPERLQLALKNKPFVPSSNFEQIVQRLEPSMKMSSETPNISSKLQALETPTSPKLQVLETPASPVSALSTEQKIAEGISKASKLDETMGKLSNLSEEALSKLGPIGQKILSTKLLTKGLPALGAVVEGRQLPKDIKKGQYLDAVGSGLGLASGLTGLAGAAVPASILAGASVGVKGGADIGRQMAEYDVGEMGMPIPSKADLKLTSGNGPFSDPDKYLNFLNSQKKETKNTDEKSINEELDKKTGESTPSSKEDINKEDVDEQTADLDETAKSDVPSEEQAILDGMALDKQQSESTVEALRNAQEEAKKERALSRLMMGADELLRGALGKSYKVEMPESSNKFWEDRLKESDQPVKDLLTRVEQEKEDPNSPISKRMREIAGPMLSKLNIKLPETATYSELQKNFPLYTKMISDQIEQKERQEERRESREFKKEQREEIQGVRTSNQVNNRYDRNTKDEINRLTSAKKVEDLIDKIKSGVLVDSENIRNTLTNDISALALPTGVRATVADRSKTAINNLYTKMKDLESFVKSNPTKTIPKSYIDQFEKETKILKDAYAEALVTKTRSLNAGEPSEIGKQIIDSRTSSLLEEYGYNPEEISAKKIIQKEISDKKTTSEKNSPILAEQKIKSVYPKRVTKGVEETEVENEREEKQANSEGWY